MQHGFIPAGESRSEKIQVPSEPNFVKTDLVQQAAAARTGPAGGTSAEPQWSRSDPNDPEENAGELR